MKRKRRRSPQGAAPGFLMPAAAADRGTVEWTAWDKTRLERDSGPMSQILARVEQNPELFHWINVEGFNADAMRALGERFQLHPLAMEDALVHQRPKAEWYPTHLFVLLQIPRLDEHLEFEQVSIFVSPKVVISVQEGRPGDCFHLIRKYLDEPSSQERQRAQDYLAYRLVDAVIDSFFPIQDELGDRLDRCEEEIFLDPGPSVVSTVRRLKRDVYELDRRLRPLSEALLNLRSLEGSSEILQEETRFLLRDCLDHVRHLQDTLTMYRETASGLMDLYLSVVTNKSNEVVTALTLITTIFMPLSFIAGVYGMNFSPDASPFNMPELRWRYGYPYALGLMFVIALIFYWYFLKRGWIGRNKAIVQPAEEPHLENTSLGGSRRVRSGIFAAQVGQTAPDGQPRADLEAGK